MAVSFEIRIRNLLPEFLADALIIFAALQTAWAIATSPLQPLFDSLNHFFIIIESNCHNAHILSFAILYDKLFCCQGLYFSLDKGDGVC